MRICIITKYIPPYSTDGIPRNRWDYAREFTALGHEVHIITSGKSESEQIINGIFIHQVPDWDEKIAEAFRHSSIPDFLRARLSYSYTVYRRIKKLNDRFPIHVIESPLWDIEGYITKVKMPEIPFVVRLETTAMLLQEILNNETPQKDIYNEVETHFLQIADGYVFDSWSILNETERLYKVGFKKPYAIIHHGIDLSTSSPAATVVKKENIHVLSVGRLEKRKGTDVLVQKILPLLVELEGFELHLVGKDCGDWDGFKKETGYSYHEYIQQHFNQYINKKIFLYGYVSDEHLDYMYNQADIILALSRYESFGLLYLEAMRKGKPLIVFNTGAVPEIFDNGKDGITVPLNQPEKVVEAILQLKNDTALRQSMGVNGFKKLHANFSAVRMGKECAAFFEELVFHGSHRRVFQIMNCLTDRDGVSNTTIDYDHLLKEKGQATQILGTYAAPAVSALTAKIESVQFNETDAIIYHYWNYCDKGEYFNNLTLPQKIFFFHNITTPTFFSADDEAYSNTAKGFKQLKELDDFDVYVGHSNYSLEILRQTFNKPIVTHIIPPIIDRVEITGRPYSEKLLQTIRKQKKFQILFVGSVAPHKKQTDLVKFFAYYNRRINPSSQLIIVGGGSPKYTEQLKALIKSLNLEEQVLYTGKTTNEDLYAYYRAADVYLSMSEHEGFGVPLAEAMTFNLPVVAYNSTAIAETTGENHCLFDQKNEGQISEIVEKLRNDPEWRSHVIALQDKQLENFSPARIYEEYKKLFKLAEETHKHRLINFRGQPNALFEEYIYFNDARLQKDGKMRFTDDQLAILENRNTIDFEEEFTEAEFYFLTHDWSGKVKLQIDDYPAETFDLFSSQRMLRGIKLSHELENRKHTVRITQTGETNPQTRGNEIFLHSIKLRKPYQVVSSRKSNRILTNGLAKTELTQVVEEDNEVMVIKGSDIFPGQYRKVLRTMDEVGALDSLFNYEGNWLIKDEFFRFADATSSSFSIQFEKEFSGIDFSFISHAWSGKVEVIVDAYREIIDLYSPQHSIKTFRLNKNFTQQRHKVIINTLVEKHRSSQGNEIFFRGITCRQEIPIEITDGELMGNYKVSVIINTLDRARHLEELLAALERQTYPYFEIVAVNGPSKDDTAEVLARYGDRIKTFSCPAANLSMSRNIGIENSSGDYVAFIDDDALPCDDYWIENFIHYIIANRQMNIGAVGGPVKHRDTEHYEFKNGATSDYGFQIFREEELKSHLLNGKRWVQGVPGGNNLVSKKALYEIGGFDERYIYYLDETDMCIRLARKNYTIVNNPVNYIKHFKAVSNVRKSAYDIRWNIIARSDMFYALKNGYDIFPIRLIRAMLGFRKKHFYLEIKKAYQDKVISLEEYRKYRKLLKKGFYEGLKWGLFYRHNQRMIRDCSTVFRNFSLTAKI